MGGITYTTEAITEKIKDYIDSRIFNFGLVIGQKCNEATYITNLAPLPPAAENEDENETAKKVTSLQSVMEYLVSSHTSQVSRMLPGGLDVLGIYVTMPVSDFSVPAMQAKLGKLLNTIHKTISKYYFGDCDKLNEKIVLFGCTQSSKIGVKYLDITNHSLIFSPGTLKTQDTPWVELDYNYYFMYPIYLSQEQASQSLLKNVLTAFRPWAKSLKDLCFLFEGQMLGESEMLIDDLESEKSSPTKRKTAFESPAKVIQVELLEKEKLSNEKPSSEFQETSGCILFRGTVSGRSYLHGKATAAEAFEAVSRDLMRSLVSRWEMHCDSLVEEPQGSSAAPVLHEPPRRVFLKVAGSSLGLCDYLFPGDSRSDACQSAKELFDIDIDESDVDDTIETLPGPAELEAVESMFADSMEKRLQESAASKYTLYFYLSVLVAFIALCLAYFIKDFNRPIPN